MGNERVVSSGSAFLGIHLSSDSLMGSMASERNRVAMSRRLQWRLEAPTYPTPHRGRTKFLPYAKFECNIFAEAQKLDPDEIYLDLYD